MSRWCRECGIYGRLKRNPLYRKRFLLTLAACLTYIIEGWVVLQYGTALPDVMLLVDVDLETASWLFSVRSIGFVVGSVLFGILLDRYERVLIMFVGTVGLAVCTLLTPYLVWYPVALGLRAINGVFAGGVDTGCNTIVPSIWGVEGGPYMQALYFSYTIGGVLAPLVTEPFMAPKYIAERMTADMTVARRNSGYTESNSIALISEQYTIASIEDTTATTRTVGYQVQKTVNGTNKFIQRNASISAFNYTSTHAMTISRSTDIQYAFIITAIVVLVSCVPYLIMFILGGFDVKASRVKEQEAESTCEEKEKMKVEGNTSNESIDRKDSVDPVKDVVIEVSPRGHSWRINVIILCVSMVNLLYSAAEECLGAYIVTFCLDYLGWDNGPSATINSVYWITSFVGGICGIGLVQLLKTGNLLCLAHAVWILAFLGALIGSLTYSNVLIWLCVPASGIFMVQIVPASFSWVEENVCEVTGKVTSVIMIFTGLGLTLNPVFTGYMMQMFSFVSFMYILLADAVVCFLFYCIAVVLNRIRVK